jgi:outer membrane protein OmpA-like peptidoglycan-associated protein/outer membrane protein W
MKLRLALAAATCLALPVVAHAQTITGPYVSLEGGGAYVNPVTSSDSLEGGSGKTLYRPNYAGIAGVGYGFGNGLRIELDGDYTHNTLSENDDSGHYKVRGHLNSYGPLLNVLYDIPTGTPFTPYLGVGGGYQFIQPTSFGGGYVPGTNPGINYGSTKGSIAADVVGGVAYDVAQVPGLAVTGEFRFIDAFQNRHYVESITGVPYTGTFKLGQQQTEVIALGVRYALFSAPPAPPPVAPPAPQPAPPAPPIAKTYLVFFDWDKSVLTPRATQIIAEAASDSKTAGTTVLSVSGYTDTSGTPKYNQGLSLRRAKAVAGQLVTDGVPAGEIEIHAYGETHLLVPTGPGVREPQNRRVEIVLQ